MSKDLYLDEVERLMAEFEDQGMPSAVAYELASEQAYGAMREKLADRADEARARAKEGRA